MKSMRCFSICFFLIANLSLAQEKPNIIFFFSDDQAYDTIESYGNPDAKTPHLDELANKGIVFLRHYNSTAICMASRANVMTGQYEYKTGCNFDHGPLALKQWENSYPLKLKQDGYLVGFCGKFGFSISNSLENQKQEGEVAKDYFDFWAGGPGQTSYKTAENKYLSKYSSSYPHSSRAYGAATIDFIRESVRKNKPFCMSVFFKAPHRPAEPDPYFNEIYETASFRKLPNYGREAGEHLAIQSRMGRQYRRFVSWGYSREQGYQESLRKYNQLIYGLDYSIGMVLDELKRLNIDDNTIIIFSSDNGYFNGSHGFGSKVLPYEESARTPLIIMDPRHEKVNKYTKTTKLTSNVDIPATILDLAGVKIPLEYDGKSIQPLLTNPQATIRKSLPIIQVWGEKATHCLAVVDENFKYIYWFYQDLNNGINATEELFDIKEDPFEMNNLAEDSEHRQKLSEMRKLYDLQLEHWKSKGVKYNGYEKYEVLFDRNIEWEEKEKLLKENLSERRFNIYPNPALNKLYIESNQKEKIEVTLLRIDGKPASSTINISAGSSVDIKKLTPGIYIVEIEHDNDIEHYNFIKQ